ncbi:MAG: hypothetical protein EPO24_04660 [Bacteroidetes bacterium]|nr:MAG: hypothetical protein EPO24_04660 [Bacteroidota bacterium]
MKELRIYYECLEQAAHFIKPIIEKTEAFKTKQIEIKLVNLKGDYRLFSKRVAAILFLKNPDILFTIIEDEIEYPIFQLEISTAAYTADHELQRFDGIVASIESNCVYGKLSPINKVSQSSHGGDTDFNYLIPYKAVYDLCHTIAFHFDWPCDKLGNVIVNNEYLSCPREIPSLTLFLKNLVNFISKNKVSMLNWLQIFITDLQHESHFASWVEELEKVELPEIRELNTSRTKWKDKQQSLYLKINRFGHAMDPERGMLSYYGTICDSVISQMCFDEENESWYKATAKESAIRNYIEKNGLRSGFDFLNCFVLASGLSNFPFFTNLINDNASSEVECVTVDLTDFLVSNFASLNKSLRTVFKFSREFQIIDPANILRVKFVWEKVNTYNNSFSSYDITPLCEKTYLTEDDISYISVHNVLKQNNYKVLAVSYPGAQGDRVVLTQAGTGRNQPRKYIDIISYLPESHTSLQENKEIFVARVMQVEINELALYKTDRNYIEGINNFIDKYDNIAPKNIKIGIGFWANSRFTVENIQDLEIAALDYFIYVGQNQKEWVVFSTGETQLFSVTKGKVQLPQTYQVIDKETSQLNIFAGE